MQHGVAATISRTSGALLLSPVPATGVGLVLRTLALDDHRS
jgi:hypothetical protein